MDRPELFSGSLLYTQESDCCDENTLGQEIVISSDGGGDDAFLIIETKRWAFDKPDDIMPMIRDAAKRLGVTGKFEVENED